MLMYSLAEFRELVEPVIPHIIALLGDKERNVRKAGADALSKLSEQGKVSNFLSWTLLMFS